MIPESSMKGDNPFSLLLRGTDSPLCNAFSSSPKFQPWMILIKQMVAWFNSLAVRWLTFLSSLIFVFFINRRRYAATLMRRVADENLEKMFHSCLISREAKIFLRDSGSSSVLKTASCFKYSVSRPSHGGPCHQSVDWISWDGGTPRKIRSEGFFFCIYMLPWQRMSQLLNLTYTVRYVYVPAFAVWFYPS